MGKYLASLLFVGCCAATPLSAAPTTNDSASIDATTTVAVHQVRVPVTGRHDQAAMVLIGTALIGLAAAVRRAA